MGIASTIREPAEGLIFQGKKSLEPILKTENLWKLYRAGKVEVPALRGVNFEVQPGESVAVMGPSGCGKSSLLYVIGGLAQAAADTALGQVAFPVRIADTKDYGIVYVIVIVLVIFGTTVPLRGAAPYQYVMRRALSVMSDWPAVCVTDIGRAVPSSAPRQPASCSAKISSLGTLLSRNKTRTIGRA